MSTLLGLVPIVGREPLAFEVMGGQSLAQLAVEALHRAVGDRIALVAEHEVTIATRHPLHRRTAVDVLQPWQVASRLDAQTVDAVVVHDPLCPLTPSDFIRDLADRAAAGRAVAAVRPVVDTIKATADDTITTTIDRETLRMVCSPVAAPAETLYQLQGLDSLLFSQRALLEALRRTSDVELVAAPSAARRAVDRSEIALMRSFDAVRHRVRERDR